MTSTVLLFKAIERVNQTVLGNGESFDQCVDAVFQMCPGKVKSAVTRRIKEYKMTKEDYVYTFWCNIRQGTPERPLKDSNGKDTSPILVKSEYVDYRSLLNVIMGELESAGFHYRTETMTFQIGDTKEKEVEIPKQTIETVKMYLDKIIEGDKSTGSKYGLYDLLNRIMPPIPETPVLAEEQEAGEALEGEAI